MDKTEKKWTQNRNLGIKENLAFTNKTPQGQLLMPFMKTSPRSKNVWSRDVEPEESSYYWKGSPLLKKSKLLKVGKFNVVELFCGCGGTSLGFEMARFQVACGVDIHKPSIETFSKNHPNAATILGDIKEIGAEDIKSVVGELPIHVLIGGVPCQGFSLNNRKRNKNDKRNTLYRELIRIAKDLRPEVIIIENVSGLISSGDAQEQIKENIRSELRMKVACKILNAQDYGVPQKRSRLFFIGLKEGNEFDFAEVIKTHGPGTKNNFVTIEQAIGDLPSLKAGEVSEKYKTNPKSTYQKMMRSMVNGHGVKNHKAPKHPAATIKKINNTKPGHPIYPRFKQRIRLKWEELSPTQVAGGIRPQFQFGHPSDNRGLTIRERCRLQSFPDSFVVFGGIVQGRVQTGNAVPPLLAKAVALSIKKYL